MGLTRAWIGAGAKAVLATKWDVPDEAAESLMVRFYSALRASPERGAAYALREAQLEALSSEGEPFGRWAGYFRRAAPYDRSVSPKSPADSPLKITGDAGRKSSRRGRGSRVCISESRFGRILWRASVAGDPAAMEELYVVFGKGVRYFLLRNVGAEEVDDKVHDCFVIVAEAIRNGELREPARLMGYVRTVVRRQIAGVIEANVTRRRTQVDYEESLFTLSDWKDDPEKTLVAQQRAEIGRRVLNGVSRRDREILHRFYVQEQSMEQICSEMDLSYNQFRLLKSRAKARFGEMGRRLAAGMGISKKL